MWRMLVVSVSSYSLHCRFHTYRVRLAFFVRESFVEHGPYPMQGIGRLVGEFFHDFLSYIIPRRCS